jgi:hypothetical protein
MTEVTSVVGETPMKWLLTFALVSLVPLTFASSVKADGERSFVGLWEGIDPVDGGDSLRSITCFEDQTCHVAVTDSVITLCGGGTGFASGEGGLQGDELVFPDVLLTCPNGEEAHLAVNYERDELNRTLVETAVVGATTLPNIIFHKVSR